MAAAASDKGKKAALLFFPSSLGNRVKKVRGEGKVEGDKEKEARSGGGGDRES